MHNNGTSPLILPDRRLLPNLQPASGVEIQVMPGGVMVIPYVGDQRLQLALDPQTALQLGANLISASAVCQLPVSQPAARPRIVDPNHHEYTDPPIAIV
jgi:hypothetical protein